VLITGGASGIGRKMAHIFADLNAVIAIWDINKEGMQMVEEEILKKGATVYIDTVDLSKRENIYEGAKRLIEKIGPVDILVNNAGIVSGKSILDEDEKYDKMCQLTMEVNTMAHFWTLRSFLPDMVKRNSGHVVTIASAAGLTGVNGLIDYCASKFGAVGLDESLRLEMRSKGLNIKTTCICPYYINTGMFLGCKTKYPFILPILEEDYVAQQIVNAVREDRPFLGLPSFIHYISALAKT
jgi:all-trans-retinol dehydrogenase (NAD+)